MEMGVKKAAKTLDVAVNETDSAILARPKSASRLELFPPGQQAIKIIPSARLGWGVTIKHIINVSRGKPIN